MINDKIYRKIRKNEKRKGVGVKYVRLQRIQRTDEKKGDKCE